jgi:DNA (cytosine-5)-methyltransferase 1
VRRPLLLDLYSGEGGAAEGYHQAGFDILGVDVSPQPRYPFAFIQADVLKLDPRLLLLADAIHASPPCQFGTELNSDKGRHLNLIPPTRALLEATGKPYVIENVRAVREHLISPISIFGQMFGLQVTTSAGVTFELSRERLFETNWSLPSPIKTVPTGRPIANVFGGHLRARGGDYRTGNGTGRTVDFPGEDRPALARELMRMPWASMKGMSEAVPPAYTRWIGAHLLERINA